MADSPPVPDAPIRLQGQLLLADPSLRDGTFNRSVILLSEHSHDDGAFGLILNHPTGRAVGDFLKDKSLAPLARIAVHEGGPVAREHLTFSAFWWQGHSLRWATRISAEDAIQHSHRPGTLVRAFVGYSGWSAGQLETELRRKAWFTLRPPPPLLGLSHDPTLWTTLLSGISPFHRIIALAPEAPDLN